MYGICVLAFTRLGKNMFVTILSKSVDYSQEPINLMGSCYSLLAVVDPHLQVSRGQSSRPWDKGGPGLKIIFFWPSGPQFGLKIRGRRGSSPVSATDWHILIWEVAMKKVNLMRVHLDWGWGGYKRHYTSHVHYSRSSTKRNAIWTYGVFRMFFETFKFAAISAFFLRKFQHNYWNKYRVLEFFLHFTNWNCS